MTPAASFLDALKRAAEAADRAEDQFRRELAERTRAFERERAFAYRRLNLMRAVGDAIASAEDEAPAVAAAANVLRAKLGWATEDEIRGAVIVRFAPVARAFFASLDLPETEAAASPDVLKALAEFEAWYAQTHPHAFWVLFEHYLPETPRVDF